MTTEEELRAALKECSDDLAEWVEHHYEQTKEHPSEARRYRRDMEPVWRARILLEKDHRQPQRPAPSVPFRKG